VIMRAMVFAALAIFAAACSSGNENQAACAITLRFGSDSERGDFLRRNAEQIVHLAESAELILASSADGAVIAAASSSSCTAFEANQAGLDITDATIAATGTASIEEATQRLAALLGPQSQWTDADTKACIVRLVPVAETRTGRLMNALTFSGLRGASVHGANGAIFGAYDDPCDLVESHVWVAVGATQSTASFCSNSSLRQCGYDGELTVGPAN
jgi:hypothetical protein